MGSDTEDDGTTEDDVPGDGSPDQRVAHGIDSDGRGSDTIGEPSEGLAEALLHQWAHISLTLSHVGLLVSVHVMDIVGKVSESGHARTHKHSVFHAEPTGAGRWLNRLTEVALGEGLGPDCFLAVLK